MQVSSKFIAGLVVMVIAMFFLYQFIALVISL